MGSSSSGTGGSRWAPYLATISLTACATRSMAPVVPDPIPMPMPMAPPQGRDMVAPAVQLDSALRKKLRTGMPVCLTFRGPEGSGSCRVTFDLWSEAFAVSAGGRASEATTEDNALLMCAGGAPLSGTLEIVEEPTILQALPYHCGRVAKTNP